MDSASTDRLSFWHISDPHVMETLDMSQRMQNHELMQIPHITSSLDSSGTATQVRKSYTPYPVILLVSGPLPSCRREKIMLHLEGMGQSVLRGGIFMKSKSIDLESTF